MAIARNVFVAGFLIGILLIAGLLLAGCSGAGAAAAGTEQQSAQAPISIYSDSPASPADSGSGLSTGAGTVATEQATPDPQETEDLAKVELLGVSLGADGAYVTILFKAPPRLAKSWQQGMVSVTDESTHVVYASIPIVPVLGALFGKPVEEGQTGYVMFSNLPPLAAGSVVTVVLGGFKQEHVTVN
jgi:hypothetical protein